MPRNCSALLLSALVVTAACVRENPTGPATAGVATKSASAGVTRPAGGSCVTTVVPVAFSFPFSTLSITGTCNLKHLGRSTLEAIQIVNVSNGTLTNTATYTAANGDLLYSTNFADFTSSPPNVAFVGTETYVGGTGRFIGASGTSAVVGSAVVGPDGSGTGEFTVKGSITY